MDGPSNTIISSEVIAEERYTLPKTRRFLPGNPGRPKGIKNKSTQIRDMLIAAAGRDTARIFRQRLRRPEDRATFTKAMDQLIALLGPSRPLAVIDQSQNHTHYTVILDGNDNPSPPPSNSTPDPDPEQSIPAPIKS